MSASDLRLSARALGLTAALVASAQALAQNPPVITDADIERVRREQPTISDQDIEQARQRHRMPSDAELEAAPAPARPSDHGMPSAYPIGRVATRPERGARKTPPYPTGSPAATARSAVTSVRSVITGRRPAFVKWGAGATP